MEVWLLAVALPPDAAAGPPTPEKPRLSVGAAAGDDSDGEDAVDAEDWPPGKYDADSEHRQWTAAISRAIIYKHQRAPQTPDKARQAQHPTTKWGLGTPKKLYASAGSSSSGAGG